ncbi:MAG: FISUMP domain-containing protein [Candidatus Sulfopaludibacter sp.]|nr:FISUMP domain-containing protein [Candidatus Sulfopaludibacter sp.]
MTSSQHKTKPIRVCVVSIALSIACGTSCERRTAHNRNVPDAMSRRMADGKQWTTHNLNVNTVPSYCYEDAELNCSQYGRLYTWESAQRGCQSLGEGWRLPTDDEWRQMAKHYGGVSEDSDNKGKAAYRALLAGGGSGFDALLGGGRGEDGRYARLEAHGFYWTASECDPASGWFYNFGRGGQAFHRQSGGEKQRAFSVRCIRE